MKEIKFDELCQQIESLGNAYIDKSAGLITWAKSWRADLKGSYEPFKEKLKLAYTRNPDELLDRHKVGACILRSVCLIKPLIPVIPGKVTPRTASINCALGLHTAIHVFQRYALEDARDHDDAIGQRRHSAAIVLPGAFNGDGTYEEQTVKGLFEATAKQTLDVFLIANLLFVLDSYHRAVWKPAAEPAE